jgi:hypothetical protein
VIAQRVETCPARPSHQWRPVVIPLIVGAGSALALIGAYLGILTLGQSASHAMEQLTQDILWVALTAAGLGTQLGLYAYLRVIRQAGRMGGEAALAGAGTGTSTIGMVACCAHHITDIAPLLGITSISALSGAASLVIEWKLPLMALGISVNAVSIAFTLRRVRRVRISPETALDAVAAR